MIESQNGKLTSNITTEFGIFSGQKVQKGPLMGRLSK